MSLERVLTTLESFGFTRVDAEVYVYLAKAGPQKGRELIAGLRMTKQQLYPALKSLQEKKVITRNRERPALFTALAFEELLIMLVQINMEQAKAVDQARKELLAHWQAIAKQDNS